MRERFCLFPSLLQGPIRSEVGDCQGTPFPCAREKRVFHQTPGRTGCGSWPNHRHRSLARLSLIGGLGWPSFGLGHIPMEAITIASRHGSPAPQVRRWRQTHLCWIGSFRPTIFRRDHWRTTRSLIAAAIGGDGAKTLRRQRTLRICGGWLFLFVNRRGTESSDLEHP